MSVDEGQSEEKPYFLTNTLNQIIHIPGDKRAGLVPGYMVKTKKDQISRKDWKYMEQKPHGDPGFSAEHNFQVIAEVDAWNDAMDRKRERVHKQAIEERATAAAQYLRNIAQGQGVTGIDKYFGRRYAAYLRGEEVVRQLKANPILVEKLKNKMSSQGQLQPL